MILVFILVNVQATRAAVLSEVRDHEEAEISAAIRIGERPPVVAIGSDSARDVKVSERALPKYSLRTRDW